MDAVQHPDDPPPDEQGSDGEGRQAASSYPGLIYGMLGGMILGTVLFVMFDQVLWLAVGLPMGMALGLAFDTYEG